MRGERAGRERNGLGRERGLSGRLGLSVLLLCLLVCACKKEDPVAVRMAQRNAYNAELTGWNWKGDAGNGTAMLNINVTCSTRQPLTRLTILIEGMGASGDAAIAQRRHSIDVSKLSYDVTEPFLVTIDNVNSGVEEGGFVVSVEPYPPAADWAEIPEMAGLPR